MPLPRIVSVIGTRPEAIKMAPLVLALEAADDFEHQLVVTAQHRDLLDDVLQLFGLTPTHDLNIMRSGQSLEYVSSSVLAGLRDVLDGIRPDFVLVHGDTTTTFCTALAAFYARIPTGHVEAGLRTSTVKEPFPEEFNRRGTDLLASHYYCPTLGAIENLRANRDCGGQLFLTGNTALDAVRLCYRPQYEFKSRELAAFVNTPGPKLLITAHRRENWGEPMQQICRGLWGALETFPEAQACFCCHPNPDVRRTVEAELGAHPRILLCEPPRFDVFINLLARCDLALSDSGGIQEEVTQLGKYVLVLRNETERPEAVESGYARVVGTEADAIVTAVEEVLPSCLPHSACGTDLQHPEKHAPWPRLPQRDAAGRLTPSPFGDGHAAERILAALRWHFGLAVNPPEGMHQGLH
jgi:UDP-N-acetylglucosamine 2-epimerase (non-hydrolysing)